MKSYRYYKCRYVLILVLIFLVHFRVNAQQGLFVTMGYSIESFQHKMPLSKIVDDFNTYTRQHFVMEKYLHTNRKSLGVIIGIKSSRKWSTSYVEIHYHRWNTEAKGSDSAMQNEIYRKIYLTHDGFHLSNVFHLIPGKHFRIGIGPGFNMEQFRAKVQTSSNRHLKPDICADKFFLSASAMGLVSFGGENFSIDIMPYYTFPFWRINFSNFNEKVNNGFSKNYPKSDMLFYPQVAGVMIRIAISGKDMENCSGCGL